MPKIKLEATYAAPKEKVWEHLVKDELLSLWCMPCDGLELKKGKRFTFSIPKNAFFDGTFYNEVKDFEEFEELEYKCKAKKPKLSTTVEWKLKEKDGQTRLKLEHEGFKPHQILTMLMLKAGWKKMMNSSLREKLAQ